MRRATVQEKAKFENFRREDGSTWSRHYASNLHECIELCLETGNECAAVNFGEIGGRKICELVTNPAWPGSVIASWVVEADGWQYACCF